VTILQDVREACGVTPGTDLFFVKNDPERFEGRVLPARRTLVEVTGQYAMDGRAPDLGGLREEMGAELTARHRAGAE
jgi:hypothetical protein